TFSKSSPTPNIGAVAPNTRIARPSGPIDPTWESLITCASSKESATPRAPPAYDPSDPCAPTHRRRDPRFSGIPRPPPPPGNPPPPRHQGLRRSHPDPGTGARCRRQGRPRRRRVLRRRPSRHPLLRRLPPRRRGRPPSRRQRPFRIEQRSRRRRPRLHLRRTRLLRRGAPQELALLPEHPERPP